MKVTIYEKGDVEVEKGTRVQDIVESFNFHKDMVVVVKDDLPVPIDLTLKDGDVLKIISVVSGG